MAYLETSEYKQKGLTLIEFLIAIGLIAVISSAIGMRLVGVRQKNSLSSTLSQIITEIKSQQVKAMVLDTEGASFTNSYGVRFETNSYTLFRGSSYNPSDSSNFVVNLGSDLSIQNVFFPSQNIIFAKGSGEISGFSPGEDSISLKDVISGEQKTIKFNINGVIVSIL